MCSCLGSLGRTLADIFSDAEKTSQATLVLCGLLGLGNIITSMIAFSSMHGIRVDLYEAYGDLDSEGALQLSKYFLSMQFGLFAIFFSTLVWGVLVVLDRFKFSVGKIFILLATMYTVLMYLTHGVSVANRLRIHTEITRGSLPGMVQRRSVRASLLLRPRRGDCQIRSSIRVRLHGHRWPRLLRLPHGLLLPPGSPRGDHRQARDAVILRQVQGRRAGHRDGRRFTPIAEFAAPPAAPTTTRLTKTRRRRGPRSSSPRTATDRRRPRPRGRTRSISRPAAAAAAPEPPRRRRIRSSKIDVRVSGGIATFYSWSRECIIELS